MADSLIRSVKPGARTQDALHKPDADKKRKPAKPAAPRRPKDKKRIIDTYA
ncbi:MAG: hypothetical protein QNJ85_02590 [Gammaproteobacteria bacterium]|nr:hypothetical protein [Gammaproteobacteria bacterium]